MAGTFEQFVVFGTDNIGLERILRLFQAICHIIVSYPILLSYLQPASSAASLATLGAGVAQLRGSLNISRRFIRLFRFLDFFQAGWAAYAAPQDKSLETWLDILCLTFLGIYGGLETATALDVLGIEGVGVFGPERSDSLNRDAMVFWFAALYTSVLCSGVKMFKLFASRPVPQTGSGYGTGEKPVASSEKEEEKTEEKELSQADQLKQERERLKGVVAKRKQERKAWLRGVSQEANGLFWKMVAETLDMLLPTTAVGWIEVDSGLVGLAMLLTTFITGHNVWKRCGKDLQKVKA